MKRCSACASDKPMEDFHLHRSRADGRQTVCKQCKQRYNAAYYEAHAVRDRAARAAARRALRRRVEDALRAAKQQPCADCGRTLHPEAMDLDHVRGDKVGDANALRRRGLAAVLQEIAKCDVVCANCHRRRTQQRRERARREAAAGGGSREI
jgi:hypothetical protein